MLEEGGGGGLQMFVLITNDFIAKWWRVEGEWGGLVLQKLLFWVKDLLRLIVYFDKYTPHTQ